MFSLIDILNISAAWLGAITGIVSLIYSLKVNRVISSTQALFNVDWYSTPFEDEIELNPYSFEKLSYYLNEPPHTIKVKTNRQIHYLSKSKSIHPIFNKAK